MGSHARIEPGGYIAIETTAWLNARTGGPLDDLTGRLHDWARHHSDTGSPIAADQPVPLDRDWLALAQAWCQAEGFDPLDPDHVTHRETRLNADVWILRAAAPDHGRIAIVGINDDDPVVYADAVFDPWAWFDSDSVDIHCPNGHGWTWGTGRELITADGTFTTITVVFGPDLNSPFTPCPGCEAQQTGRRTTPCACGGIPWIRCPECGLRCDVELPPA